MISIAIVEDDRKYADILQKKIQQNDFGEETSVEIYTDPNAFLNSLKEGKEYQLCFSDIEMPGMSGIQMAEEIRKTDDRMMLIFVSSYLIYATKGYRVDAFDYLLKEEMDDRWDEMLQRVRRHLKDDQEKIYRIVTENSVKIIWRDNILYIMKEGKYCRFVLEDGRESVRVRKTLQEVADELRNDKRFIQIKRGYIINLDKIRQYTKEEIVMANGEKLVVGRTRVAEVKEQVARYVREFR